MPELVLNDLRVRIADVLVCAGLSVSLRPGQNWAILGANGSGKTTLLHTLAGLRGADAGMITLGGRPLAQIPGRERARQLGVVLQDTEELFPVSVLELVLMGRHPHLSRWQWEGEHEQDLATSALAAVGLSGFEQRTIHSLSGGELRRTSIATLLAQNPPLCMLDEPTNHLDIKHQVSILDTLHARVRRPGHSNVFVLHDVNLARRFCSHAILLFGDGHTAHGKIGEVLNADSLEQTYHWPIRELVDDGQTFYLPR